MALTENDLGSVFKLVYDRLLEITGRGNVNGSQLTTVEKSLARLLALVADFSLKSGCPMRLTSYVRLTEN